MNRTDNLIDLTDSPTRPADVATKVGVLAQRSTTGHVVVYILDDRQRLNTSQLGLMIRALIYESLNAEESEEARGSECQRRILDAQKLNDDAQIRIKLVTSPRTGLKGYRVEYTADESLRWFERTPYTREEMNSWHDACYS